MYEFCLNHFAALIFSTQVMPDVVLVALTGLAMSAYHDTWKDRHGQMVLTGAHNWFTKF